MPIVIKKSWNFIAFIIWSSLLSLLILLLAIIYLTCSQHGLQQIPKIISRYTPYQISAQAIEGRLLGKQKWRQLKLVGADIDFSAEEIALDFSILQLLNKKIHIHNAAVSNSKLNLKDSDNKNNNAIVIPNKLPQIKLPVDIKIDAIKINNLAIKNNNEEVITINNSATNLNYQRQTQVINLESTTRSDRGDLTMLGDIHTKEDFPLNLQLKLQNDQQQIAINVDESLLNPHVMVFATGDISGKLEWQAQFDLMRRNLQSSLKWFDINYQKYHFENGHILLGGELNNIALQIYSSYEIEKISTGILTASANFVPQKVKDIFIRLELLGGNLNANAQIDYGNLVKWQTKLTFNDIDINNYDPNLKGVLQGEIANSGNYNLNNKQLNSDLNIENIKGYWQKDPLLLSGHVNYKNDGFFVDDLQFDFAQNKLHINGYLTEEKSDLKISLNAHKLNNILSSLKGNLQGYVNISGKLLQPLINGNLQWNEIKYRKDNNDIFYSPNGKIVVDGGIDGVNVAINSKAKGIAFPMTNVNGKFIVDKKYIDDIKIDIGALDGNMNLNGKLQYQNPIAWQLNIAANKLNPKQYISSLDGRLNGNIRTQGSYKDDKLIVKAIIDNVNGVWQGSKLKANGKILLNGNELSTDNIEVAIGENKLHINGALTQQQANISVQLLANKLKQLYPQLRGQLQGQLKIAGNWQYPQIEGKLTGEQFSYDNYHIGSILLDIKSMLKKGGVFNNKIDLKNIVVNSGIKQNISIDTKGFFERHKWQLLINGNTLNAALIANGEFLSWQHWRGKFSKLNAALYGNNWRNSKNISFDIGTANIKIDDLCLQDNYSNLCVNLQKDKNIQLSWNIDKLQPQSFSHFIPKGFQINTALNSKGKLSFVNNNVVDGQIEANIKSGNINIKLEKQAPVNIPLQTSNLNLKINNNHANGNWLVDFAELGTISGKGNLKNLKDPEIAAQIKVNLTNIGKFKYLIPKVSKLSGNINGAINIGGKLSNPNFNGEIMLQQGNLVIPEYATQLNNVRLKLTAKKNGQIDIDGNLGTPEGNLKTKGELKLIPLALDIDLQGENMLIANSRELRLLLSPKLHFKIKPNDGIYLSGQLLIPQADIALPDTSTRIAISNDVVINNANLPNKKKNISNSQSPFFADVKLQLGKKVYLKTGVADIHLIGGLNFIMRPGNNIKARGEIEIDSGIYTFYGQELNINHGKVSFVDNITNPSLDIVATRKITDVEVGAKINGSVNNMELNLYSEPSLPDSAILSYLMFGRAPDKSMDSESLLQTAANLTINTVIPKNLNKKTGLDVLDLGVSGIKAGKYLTEDVYLGMRSNFFTTVTQFVARYQINDRLSAEMTAEAEKNAIDFLYEFDAD